MPSRWTLEEESSTGADLARLLARLAPDLERAGREYERLRRTLIRSQGERREKISNRRRLAGSLRVSENALRSRVQRVRDRLERSVHGCVSQAVR